MRTISEAEKYWRQLDGFHSLTELKISVSSHNEPAITAGLRSVCWKIFLIFKSLDRSTWLDRLNESRAAYGSLRSRYMRAIQHPDEFESSVDPLTENEESPWVALRADESLRAEIFQDIERCMPDNVYFRQPETQNMMLDILFVWCKMHPAIGYRQGMHEILAPILWVVERDAVDAARTERKEVDDTLVETMDSTYIEHDTSALFSLVMQTAKSFYAPADPDSASKVTPMLARSARIFDLYLPKADPGLSAHMLRLEIVPQIFLLRWIRLLFGREFPLDSVLNMWDALFAIDPSLELVDMISVTMLLRIRWQLVDADTNEAFSLLLRYPEPDAPAYTFIKDALYLRDHLTPEGGAEIITRYGKRAPFIEETPPQIHLPPPSPSFGSSRTRNGLASPKNFITQQSGGIEGLIQNAAKGVLDRGSQWGVGKAIRDAVGEVKKNVEAYQTGAASPPVSGQSTPRAGGREYRKPARIASDAGVRPSLDRTLSANVVRRVEGLEKRNKGLAKMLESAVGELWEYHRQRSENAKENQDALEMLSLAIAKVQFVQVYLEDSSIPLPVDETTETGVPSTPNLKISDVPEPTPSMPPQTSNSRSTSSATNAPDTSLLSPTPRPNSPSTQGQSSSPGPSSGSSSGLPSTLPSRTRPLLSSANFSWMLGENSASESTRSAFAKASEHSAFSSDEKRRMRGSMGKGYLFGDDDDDDASSPVEARDKRASISGKVKGKKDGHVEEVEEEIIDLGELGKKGAVS